MARPTPWSENATSDGALNPITTSAVTQVMRVVKVRLSGDLPGISQAIAALGAAVASVGGYADGVTSPYPNRREPGYRVYLALRFPPEVKTGCGAAHRHQAIDCPAAAQVKEAFPS